MIIVLPNRVFRFLQSVLHFCVAVLCANLVTILTGSTLLEIKKSFRNVGNVLYDWAGDDYCSWRGVLCDNVTFAVAAL
jgi:LRR receptor-like serine/threonine-protein kinase ERECTA